MKNAFWAFWVVATLIFVGCSSENSPSPGPVESPEKLVGLWEQKEHATNREAYIQYFEDGTYWCAKERADLDEDTNCIGEYWFENGQYHDRELTGTCPSNSVAIYDVQRLESGKIKFTPVEDICPPRILGLSGLGEFEGKLEWKPIQ